ncbi:hypothetical protein SEA_GOCRAZY_19 [Arthrobacter phage GoCrazy]|uniref:Uncharacterized protein n=2 Tax=Mudcatvirus TaxID=1982088 RepID=A0AAE7SU15_9CAUD|nr:hypothetical protein PQB81_gp019 [Arthrobacter phage Kardesai]YP_010666897.1 hypothetical protein PQB83_gp19 [Arthrobacter phage KeaneyLin]QXO13518.1 hypothetical protein SEA_GOCRAZY_19 [Arthrobacter phage GoCrazy]WBF79065.1 hypothetical protein SEA_HANKLY_19 [Arthrobacter phage Hankly]AXH44157.1 hypothetical protein SEA_KEANEYLIN_19 [Arthrobacter phage KeaneyLin]QXO12926.1 hypothetical protein SEA_KARDESAI_19 [Arthrobacter phage Kardesai]
MRIRFESRGSWKRTDDFLRKMSRGEIYRALSRYGQEGVKALSSATPVESGETAGAWGFEVKVSGRSYSIEWTNSHVVNGVPIAIILQYGHGTGTGGYVQGRDYINPAIKPVMDRIANQVWKEVTSA